MKSKHNTPRAFQLGLAIGIVATLEGLQKLEEATQTYTRVLFYLLVIVGAIQVVSSLCVTRLPDKMKRIALKAPIYFELFYVGISLVQTFVLDLPILLRLSCLGFILLLLAVLAYALHLVHKKFCVTA